MLFITSTDILFLCFSHLLWPLFHIISHKYLNFIHKFYFNCFAEQSYQISILNTLKPRRKIHHITLYIQISLPAVLLLLVLVLSPAFPCDISLLPHLEINCVTVFICVCGSEHVCIRGRESAKTSLQGESCSSEWFMRVRPHIREWCIHSSLKNTGHDL